MFCIDSITCSRFCCCCFDDDDDADASSIGVAGDGDESFDRDDIVTPLPPLAAAAAADDSIFLEFFGLTVEARGETSLCTCWICRVLCAPFLLLHPKYFQQKNVTSRKRTN